MGLLSEGSGSAKGFGSSWVLSRACTGTRMDVRRSDSSATVLQGMAKKVELPVACNAWRQRKARAQVHARSGPYCSGYRSGCEVSSDPSNARFLGPLIMRLPIPASSGPSASASTSTLYTSSPDLPCCAFGKHAFGGCWVSSSFAAYLRKLTY